MEGEYDGLWNIHCYPSTVSYVFHRTQQEMIGTFGLESCSYSLLDVSLIFTRGPINALLLFKGK